MPFENADKADKADKGLEQESSKASENSQVSREAEAGKAAFVQGHIQQAQEIKEGKRRSGISQLLGKPKFFDSKENAERPAAQTFKTGEKARLSLNELRAQSQSESGEAESQPPKLGETRIQRDEKTEAEPKAFLHRSVSGIFGKPQFFDSGNEISQAKDKLMKKVESFSKAVPPEAVLAKSGPEGAGTTPAEKAADKASEKPDSTDKSLDPQIKKVKDAGVALSPEEEKELSANLAEINKLPEEERKRIQESIDKIANASATEGTKLDARQKAELITSLARQIAHPETIKQGAKDTCVSANIEKTLAMTHPGQYADMLAKLASTGEYTTPDGKTTVKAQREPDGKLSGASDSTKQRTAASEVMQTAITNMGMPEGETYKSYMPGKEPIPEGLKKDDDSGERVLGADGKEKRFEGLSRSAKEDILNKLMPGDNYQARKIQSAEDLAQAWKDNGGKAPLHVTVRINAEHTGMGSAKDGAAGTHAVVITHMEFGPDGKPTQIYYENTADSADHSYPNGKPVAADEFVKSMQQERSHQYRDGSIDRWPEPMTATVRTDGKDERQSKSEDAKNQDLDKAVDEFRDATHKDAWFFDYGTDREQMRKALAGRPRWEIEEINKRYKEKYGVSLDDEIVDELQGRERVQFRDLLKGKDTQTEAAPPKR